MYELVNVVGGGRVSTELDLYELMERLDAQHQSFEPESFAALVLRFKKDSPTIIIFSNGKYNIAGASSVGELLSSKENIVDNLEQVTGKKLYDSNTFEIRNLIYKSDIGSNLDLQQVSKFLGTEYCELDKEHNPALQYRPSEFSGLFQIFRTGKLTYIGNSDQEMAEEAVSEIVQRLQKLVD